MRLPLYSFASLLIAYSTFALSTPARASSTTTTTQQNPAVVQPVGIVAPHDLRRTTDKNECFAHGGGVYCQDASQLRQPVLIWEWNGNLTTIDGFHLYKVTGGRSLAQDIPARLNQKITWSAWTAKPGTCYVVTAYKAQSESADSNKWCAPFVIEPVQQLSH
jgi:hypothetical protein